MTRSHLSISTELSARTRDTRLMAQRAHETALASHAMCERAHHAVEESVRTIERVRRMSKQHEAKFRGN